jgi:hypothetical protein
MSYIQSNRFILPINMDLSDTDNVETIYKFIIIIISNMKSSCDIIISINVHHKPSFHFDQLNNIKAFVKLEYVVILNCNKYMYNELKKNYILDSNIVVNDTHIERKKIPWHIDTWNRI